MKIKNIFYVAALVTMIVYSYSCTKDFEEINTNPNDPGIAQAAPGMLLTNAIESMTDRVHEIFFGHEMGSCWVQHMAKVQYPDEDRYTPRISVINNTWNSFYAASGYDVQALYNTAVKSENESYQAIALILKSYIASVLTDEWGDVPYSEAWKGSDPEKAILSPSYDTQESIYASIIENLKTANELLSEDGPEIEGDILFDNDLMAWKKFANSLRLRLLMRRSDRVNPTADMTAIFGDPATYPVFEGVEDNAALKYLGSAPNNNPINENRKTRDDHRVSKTLVDYLYTEAPSPDYRVSVYAELDGNNEYEGLPNGMLSNDAANYNGNGLKYTSKIGSYFSNATAPGMLMSYSELLFIKAEAAARGFIPGGHTVAEQAFHEAIRASWDQYNADGSFEAVLEDVWRSTFESWGMTENDDIYEFAWEDFVAYGGTYDYNPATAVEQIATQKWVAMFDQGIQAVFEWRRTGFPVLTPAIAGTNNGKIPVRAYYPSDEAGRNPTNLQDAITRQGPDDLNTKVWWDVK